MVAHAGDIAPKKEILHCAGCHEAILVRKGERVPRCGCGSENYESHMHEPGVRNLHPSRRRGSM